MNVLMFVMAMLMMLSIMTYAKFDKFRMQATLNTQFENYMKFVECRYINERAEDLYKETHVKDKNGKQGDRNGNSSKLPIGLLLEASTNDVYLGVRSVLRELINELYAPYKFYKEMQQERPDFVDEMISALPYAKKNLPGQQKITKSKDLANLDLGNRELNEVYYKMLKGAEFPYETKEGIVEEGYPSLVEYITTKQGKKLRVYLAPEVLLKVVFNESTAEEIVSVREYLYGEVNQERLSAVEASNRLKSMFEDKVGVSGFRNNLDYSVTKTNPKMYR